MVPVASEAAAVEVHHGTQAVALVVDHLARVDALRHRVDPGTAHLVVVPLAVVFIASEEEVNHPAAVSFAVEELPSVDKDLKAVPHPIHGALAVETSAAELPSVDDFCCD